MDLIPACLEHLHQLVRGLSPDDSLTQRSPAQWRCLLDRIADTPHAVSPGWGNVHSYKILLFHLNALRADVRDRFVARLLADLDMLSRRMAVPAGPHEAPEACTAAAQMDRRCGGESADQPQTAADRYASGFAPVVPHGFHNDWFDRLLDWAAAIADGLGFGGRR
jgi:hypothetical protein